MLKKRALLIFWVSTKQWVRSKASLMWTEGNNKLRKIIQETAYKLRKRITPIQHQIDLAHHRNFEICSQDN